MPRIQYDFPSESDLQREIRSHRRGIVKETFLRCWRSYKDGAWLSDELARVTGSGNMAYGGWATTLVDSLDTLLILGLMQEFKDATKASTSLDFAWSHEAEISTFGTNIRYLGAFLAAYDLSGDHALLYKAIEVGELLLAAFDTPSHLPVAKFRWQEAASGAIQNTSFTTIAELGSYSLEFTHLSQVTGDMRFYDASLRGIQLKTSLPGMWPQDLDARCPVHRNA